MNQFSRMTRCECHETPFSEVLEKAHATGVEDIDTLCRLSECGQTCTACRRDLAAYLEENLKTPLGSPYVPLHELAPAGAF